MSNLIRIEVLRDGQYRLTVIASSEDQIMSQVLIESCNYFNVDPKLVAALMSGLRTVRMT